MARYNLALHFARTGAAMPQSRRAIALVSLFLASGLASADIKVG
jgi:hypothetical protein